MKHILFSAGALVTSLWFASCASYNGADSSNYTAKREAAGSAASAPEKSRPGLGTAWGETQRSEISMGSFERASSSPASVTKLYYNDESGAKAMADSSGFRWRSDGRTTTPDGSVTVSLKSGFRTLKGFSASGQEFVVGESGQRYAIELKNNTSRRLEVVVSVDGLDVLDGRSASYGKRGYILQPNRSFTIKGFRRSTSEVAAFRFSSVSNSYAERKHGDSRNVGVIGAAVFSERTPREVDRRFAADPFASPPR